MLLPATYTSLVLFKNMTSRLSVARAGGRKAASIFLLEVGVVMYTYTHTHTHSLCWWEEEKNWTSGLVRKAGRNGSYTVAY